MMFYRCGHCKKLAPILDKLAESVKDMDQLRVGKLDSVFNTNVSTLYDVKMFPTLIYFKDGFHGKYEGQRTHESMILFMQKMTSPHLAYTRELVNINEIYATNQVVFMLSLPDGISTESENMWKDPFDYVARKMHVHATFFIRHIQDASVTTPQIAMMEKGRPARNFIGDVSSEAIEQFVNVYNRPFISEVDSHNFKSLNSLERVTTLAVLNTKAAITPVIIDALDGAASKLSTADNDLFVFGHIDGIKWKRFLKQYEAATTPRILMLDLSKEHYLSFPIDINASPQDLESYIHEKLLGVVSGTLSFKKFQVLPLHQRIVKKLRDYYPWSLLCFTPVLLLVISIFIVYPDEPKMKKS